MVVRVKQPAGLSVGKKRPGGEKNGVLPLPALFSRVDQQPQQPHKTTKTSICRKLEVHTTQYDHVGSREVAYKAIWLHKMARWVQTTCSCLPVALVPTPLLPD